MSKLVSNHKYRYFSHKECEYYPCHDFEPINCKFCWCPLYFFNCGGNFIILDNGIKDCSNCRIPHMESGHDYIVDFLNKHYFRKDKNELVKANNKT